MKKLDEHSQWDEEWARAFEDASQTPPPGVWNNIHAVQANKEADKFRKRAFYYKWIAAASVFLSICSAAFLVFNSNIADQKSGVAGSSSSQEQLLENSNGTDTSTNSLAESPKDSRQEGVSEEESVTRRNYATRGTKAESFEGNDNPLAKASKPTGRESVSSQKQGNKNQEGGGGSIELPPAREDGAFADSGNSNDEDPSSSSTMVAVNEEDAVNESAGEGFEQEDKGDGELADRLALFSISKKDLLALMDENKNEKVEAEIRKVWLASDFFKKDASRSVPRYMLGATLASNSFSANYQDEHPEMKYFAENANDFQSTKLSPLSNARITDWDEEQKSSMSITGGLQAAAWLGKRWVLQGGLQYGNYKSASKASTYTDASGNNSYPLHFANYSEEKVQTASFGRGSSTANTVSATNAFEFLSVPLNIGYVVIDRRISLLLAPGISSEFFLSNTLSANEEGSGLNSYTVSNGEESPYSFVHFKGLLGAQLFYRLSDNYIISIEPGYQHAITDFNKADSFFSSRPSNISMAAGFRYVFH